jgi:hypothetical protein
MWSSLHSLAPRPQERERSCESQGKREGEGGRESVKERERSCERESQSKRERAKGIYKMVGFVFCINNYFIFFITLTLSKITSGPLTPATVL